jgi:hypothetical protein
LFASLAWGAEGARVDIFDARGDRQAEWILTWNRLLALVSSSAEARVLVNPVARAGPLGVDFMATDDEGSLLVSHWSWAELLERAKMSASLVG